MSNPFSPLLPTLELIAREARVLPATGQAMEDMVRPDHAELIDKIRTGDDNVMDCILEKPNTKPYVKLTPLHRTQKHLFRYFLDGSARVFFLADIVEGKRRSSLHIAQIGASCIYRHDDGHVRVAGSIYRIVIMADKQQLSFGEQLEKIVNSAGGRFTFHDTMQKDGESEQTAHNKEPRSRAPHKAHHLMTELEKELGKNLKRKPGEWLVFDGSLSKDFFDWKDVPDFLGVTKSFNKEPLFKLPGARGGKTVGLYELLADLNFSHRTCAFSAQSGKKLVWYVRIHEQRNLEYPLMGVLKVELPNYSTEAVYSSVIDEISSALVAERQVTPHGKDNRWHAHLYAVYLAEQAVKNGFISTEALKSGIRWPLIPALTAAPK